MLYIFITSVYLVYVVDNGYTFGAKGGYQQGYACTYIGRGHIVGSEPKFSVVSDDDSTVRVAKYYLCPHIDEFVHEKESALEHFLVYQDTAFVATTSITLSRSGVSPGQGASAMVIMEPSINDSIR